MTALLGSRDPCPPCVPPCVPATPLLRPTSRRGGSRCAAAPSSSAAAASATCTCSKRPSAGPPLVSSRWPPPRQGTSSSRRWSGGPRRLCKKRTFLFRSPSPRGQPSLARLYGFTLDLFRMRILWFTHAIATSFKKIKYNRMRMHGPWRSHTQSEPSSNHHNLPTITVSISAYQLSLRLYGFIFAH